MTGAGKLLLPWFCLLALPHQEKRMSLNSIKLFFFFWSFLKEKSLPYSDFFIKKNKNKKEEGDSSQIIL